MFDTWLRQLTYLTSSYECPSWPSLLCIGPRFGQVNLRARNLEQLFLGRTRLFHYRSLTTAWRPPTASDSSKSRGSKISISLGTEDNTDKTLTPLSCLLAWGTIWFGCKQRARTHTYIGTGRNRSASNYIWMWKSCSWWSLWLSWSRPVFGTKNNKCSWHKEAKAKNR